DNPQRALKNKGIAHSGCSRHMTGNKAYLVEYQDYNGSPVAFGVSAASLINTAMPKLSTARLGWCCSKVFNNGVDAWIGSKMQFGLDLREKLVLPGKVGAARHKDSAARQKFVLLVTVITVGGNLEFHEIVDFLTSISIHLALTVSPTIYISYIEQFWNIASSQTVNDEKQIHATVNSKALVVTEAFIRSYLLLNDAVGTACLTNEAIFQNLALMGYEGELNKLTFQKALFSPQWKKGVKFSGKVTPLFDSMLVPHQAPGGEGSKQLTEPQPTPSPTQPSTGDQPPVTDSSSSHDTTQDSRDSLEGTNRSEGDQVQPSDDSNLSGGPTSDIAKGGMTLEELSILCTNLSNRVLALEASKDAQAT
ncbi:hypothetical protein Tco_1413871, partial [Tanacetum coccineum]